VVDRRGPQLHPHRHPAQRLQLVEDPAEIVIDWDNAGPGAPLWDVAYAIHVV
jgi:hypothetical protein